MMTWPGRDGNAESAGIERTGFKQGCSVDTRAWEVGEVRVCVPLRVPPGGHSPPLLEAPGGHSPPLLEAPGGCQTLVGSNSMIEYSPSSVRR
jgi:hypothetical protein